MREWRQMEHSCRRKVYSPAGRSGLLIS